MYHTIRPASILASLVLLAVSAVSAQAQLEYKNGIIWDRPERVAMATHSSILFWRIPWAEEPGGLYSPWSCRVGPD